MSPGPSASRFDHDPPTSRRLARTPPEGGDQRPRSASIRPPALLPPSPPPPVREPGPAPGPVGSPPPHPQPEPRCLLSAITIRPDGSAAIFTCTERASQWAVHARTWWQGSLAPAPPLWEFDTREDGTPHG